MITPEIPPEIIEKAARAAWDSQPTQFPWDEVEVSFSRETVAQYRQEARAALSAVYSDIWREARVEAFEEATQAIEDDVNYASAGHPSTEYVKGQRRAAWAVRSLAGKETP